MAIAKKKVNINKTLLITYLVVSALFILMSAFNYFKFSVYNAGVQNGVATAVNEMITKASDSKCQPFNVYSGKAEVSLVNVACLQQAAPQAAAQQQAPAPTPEQAPAQ